MKDFPVFTTEYGAASLVLKEIPYKQTAYITILDSLEPEALLAECVSFCRVCGAERIYAAGHAQLERFPLHTAVWELRGEAEPDPELVAHLFPVTEQTVTRWRTIYNERMRGVDNAATLEARDEKEILASGGAYFVHQDGETLGIGWISGGELLAVAAVKPGAGARVMHTLLSMMPGQPLKLQVASTNQRALRLYEKLGFIRTRSVRGWYRVFPGESAGQRETDKM